MKFLAIRFCIVCVGLIVVNLILTGVSNAKIDPGSCIGLWLFDEGKGDVAKDSSKNGRDGKLLSGPEWTNGKFGKAVKFNGAGDHVLVDEVEIPQNNWSIASWVNRVAPLGGIWISHNKSRTNNNNLHLFFRDGNGGKPEIDFYGNALVANTVVDEGVWAHVAFVVESNGNRKAYVNGKLDKSDVNATNYTGGKAPLYIGMFFDCCRYKGLVDEVGIFNVALSQNDIEDIVNNGLGKATSLIAVSPKDHLTTVWGEIKILR